MRVLLALLLSLSLSAQEAAKPADQAKPEGKKEAAAQPASEEQKAASPVPAGESSFTGSVDFGYRWVDFKGGSFPTYRSIVNLGEGVKLFGADFTFQDPKKRLFDRLDVRANNWGGDPYNTVSVSARKAGLYDLRADYRNIVYYNFLPSFADPTVGLGVFLDQRSYDIHRRTTDIQLDLFPGRRIIPYLGYGRNSNAGRGITTFVTNANEYPVTNQLRDAMDNYRGGVRLEMTRWHLTLEQGGTVLKDDQHVYTADRNLGNRTTPYFTQTLSLNTLQQAYGVRGHSIYSKALATASPFTWLNLYGQFLYSQPQNDIRYSQNNAGLFANANPLLFFTAQQDLFSGVAKMPHTSGSAGAELRPFRRLRIVEAWMTDRLHNSASSFLTEQLLLSGGAGTQTPLPLGFANLLVMNYNQQQVDAFYDVTKKITLRGGHRYVWGDSIVPPSSLTPAGERGEERRQVGLAGLAVHTGGKFSANVDFEGASASRSYFRTSLNDYQLLRARARYQAFTTLSFAANFSYLNNENPDRAIDYKYLSRSNTLSAFWTPGGGKRASVIAEYTRSSLRSDIGYLNPSLLSPERSLYRDNAHVVNGLLDVALPSYGGLTPRLSFGGAFFLSSGSRPTRFYQPVGRLALPLHKHVSWVTEWRWYGYGEPFYLYEAFRAHLFTTGMRITR